VNSVICNYLLRDLRAGCGCVIIVVRVVSIPGTKVIQRLTTVPTDGETFVNAMLFHQVFYLILVSRPLRSVRPEQPSSQRERISKIMSVVYLTLVIFLSVSDFLQ
jgi:hypothetical protein